MTYQETMIQGLNNCKGELEEIEKHFLKGEKIGPDRNKLLEEIDNYIKHTQNMEIEISIASWKITNIKLILKTSSPVIMLDINRSIITASWDNSYDSVQVRAPLTLMYVQDSIESAFKASF